jgi:hypothetical protein
LTSPALQWVHSTAPIQEKAPGSQDWQVVTRAAAMAAENVPGSHGMQVASEVALVWGE